ncbi:unnamed protein product [Phaedon cochleariae]|uniref:G-patch domain-containing protein n=1 Tax=Phaedon cochleariae TaxID=80249 RepID=A0A9P0DMF1_PHACE|nr:unnamed protein product [Phaedon cochleariae]
MSKKNIDSFQTKITRNDRFAQMSYQEKLIEQKKREIQAKLDAKEKTKVDASKVKIDPPAKSSSKSDIELKNNNAFSNDGSFLDQFKQLKETKKTDSKPRSFNRSKDRFSDDRNKPNNRWGPRKRSPSPKDSHPKRVSRFSNEKMSNFEPKITISTSFSNSLVHQKPPPPPPATPIPPTTNTPNMTSQTLLKDIPLKTLQLNTAPQIHNVQPLENISSNTNQTFIPTPIFTTVNLPLVAPVPPPPVELAKIPPPNPIQVRNIPPPEPLNALTIPQPAPMQVQNIPTPTALQLNQIPNPKPLDLMAIPTPNENISDPEFLKNIPPPNRSVPPPQMPESQPSQMDFPPTPTQMEFPPKQPQIDFPPKPTEIDFPPMVSSPSNIPRSTIPSLMSKPILPPPGMSLNINMNCPPPMLNFGGQGTGNLGQLPSMNVPPPAASLPMADNRYGDMDAVFHAGTAEFESMTSLGRMVAECGNSIEDIVRQRKKQDPHLWFLFHKESAAYRQYRRLIEQFKAEKEPPQGDVKPKVEKDFELYEPEMALDDTYEEENNYGDEKVPVKSEEEEAAEKKRMRKSRWGGKKFDIPPPSVLMYNTAAPQIGNPSILPMTPQISQNQAPVQLSKVGRTDPGLLQYAINTYGTPNLSEEDWKKIEDHYKINLLYQDMVRKREEVERLQMAGKHKYEYDSDEDVEGGTWEHKARDKEMMATELWAQELNRQAEGKHHIGDFLPPDELKRFMEKSTAVKEGREPNLSDYKEFKIKEDNVGFRMLQKLGWSEGEGLGSGGMGIVEPVNKAPPRENTQGLGLNFNQPEEDEDEYESYRKRMMLAYRFRPNPLNNPRRPYY